MEIGTKVLAGCLVVAGCFCLVAIGVAVNPNTVQVGQRWPLYAAGIAACVWCGTGRSRQIRGWLAVGAIMGVVGGELLVRKEQEEFRVRVGGKLDAGGHFDVTTRRDMVDRLMDK